MKIKVWQHKENESKDILFLCNYQDCTQEYIEKNYNLICETETTIDNNKINSLIFNNFSYNGKLYYVHQIHSYKDTEHKIKNVFVSPYQIKSLKEIKQKPQIENINNAICPICGYVDYDCWENDCPDENYRCPQCKSNLLLEHRIEGHYDTYATLYQRTTFKKLHRPKELNNLLKGMNNEK